MLTGNSSEHTDEGKGAHPCLCARICLFVADTHTDPWHLSYGDVLRHHVLLRLSARHDPNES